jgi:hypothetical protein
MRQNSFQEMLIHYEFMCLAGNGFYRFGLTID